MKPFSAVTFQHIAFGLGAVSGATSVGAISKDSIIREDTVLNMIQRFSEAKLECNFMGLNISSIHFEEVKNELLNKKDDIVYTEVSKITEELANTLRREMKSKKFFYIPAERAGFYESVDLFGKEVSEHFPSSKDEIIEAANCLATLRTTATVFHLVRVMEWGVKAVWKSLGKSAPKKENSWGMILKDLEAELNKSPKDRSAIWNQYHSFFSEVTVHVRAIKNAWRDTTMHVEKSYDEPQAMRVFNASKDFMQTVAAVLDENGQWV